MKALFVKKVLRQKPDCPADSGIPGIDPFCLIFFTDMECLRFPAFTPAYPVLWIRTGHAGFMPPFGDIIDLLPDGAF